MILRNSLNFIHQFFNQTSKFIRKLYVNSNYYDKKISKVYYKDLFYKPSPHLLSSLIKYQNKKINLKDINTENIWNSENLNTKNFKKLNNFYWFFSLDLKSSKIITQTIINEWIKKNQSTFDSWLK